MAGSLSLVRILSITYRAFPSLTGFLLFSSQYARQPLSTQPLPCVSALARAVPSTRTAGRPPGPRTQARGPHTGIALSPKPSWTWPLLWVPGELGPRVAMSAVTPLPCLAHGFLRTVTDVVTVSAFTQERPGTQKVLGLCLQKRQTYSFSTS